MRNIVIFASGNGSNALNLIKHFNGKGLAQVKAVFCNKKEAGVLEKAISHGVDAIVFNKSDFYSSDNVIQAVVNYQPDLIVLAGFLWLVPADFIESFDGRIINLHPSLLPKYGGKGMFGHHVHQAVLDAGEKTTGITVHLVNTEFDKGEIIYQASFEIPENATLELVEAKIHELESVGLPKAVENFFHKLKI